MGKVDSIYFPWKTENQVVWLLGCFWVDVIFPLKDIRTQYFNYLNVYSGVNVSLKINCWPHNDEFYELILKVRSYGNLNFDQNTQPQHTLIVLQFSILIINKIWTKVWMLHTRFPVRINSMLSSFFHVPQYPGSDFHCSHVMTLLV